MHKRQDKINLDTEFSYVVSLVRDKWNTTDSLEQILKIFWDKGVFDSKDDLFICANDNALLYDIQKLDFLSNLPKDNFFIAFNHHLPFLLQKKFIKKNAERADSADKIVRVNIEPTIKNLYLFIKNNFPEYNKNRPFNWSSAVRKYGNDISQFPEDYETYADNFKGHSVLNMGEFFPETAAVSALLYRRERENHFSPILFLGRSVYQHAFFCNRFNHGLEIKESFINIYNYFNQSEKSKNIQGEFDFSILTQQPFLLEVANKIPQTPDKEIEKLIKDQNADISTADVTDEEHRQNKRDNIDAILNIIKKHRF